MRSGHVVRGLWRILRTQIEEISALRTAPDASGLAYWRGASLVAAAGFVVLFAALPWALLRGSGGHIAGAFFGVAGIWSVVVTAVSWLVVAFVCLLVRNLLTGGRRPERSITAICAASFRRIAEGTGVAVLLSLISTFISQAFTEPSSVFGSSAVGDLGLVQLAVLVFSLALLFVLELPRICIEALAHLPGLFRWLCAIVLPIGVAALLSLSPAFGLPAMGEKLLDQLVPASVEGYSHLYLVKTWASQLWKVTPVHYWPLVPVAVIVQALRLGSFGRLFAEAAFRGAAVTNEVPKVSSSR